MIEAYRAIVRGQFEASLGMLRECVRACPAEHWEATVGTFRFWQVAFHTLYFVDMYVSRERGSFQPGSIQVTEGVDAFDMDAGCAIGKDAVMEYLVVCRTRMEAALAAETEASLAGPSGFDWLEITRGELHLYNFRHVQHHVGQLAASLRRIGVETPWISSGWE